MLADWQVTNNALLRQLDQVLYQLSDGVAPDRLQQVQQMLFVELKLIAEGLQEEMYSKNSWWQLEKLLLQVDTLDILFATQIQQAYFSKLVTRVEEEQQTRQGGFQELQETILVIETLLVETSVTGEEITALRAQLLGKRQHYSSKEKFSYSSAANKLVQKLNRSINDAQ